ncbi:MAG: GTPase HflX [Firmicutes bacterium]|nr:GTPase HflX [Bacillota bacterium]
MEKAILVGVNTTPEEIEELRNLASACDIEVVSEITQTLSSPHVKTYINQGKVEQVRTLTEVYDPVDWILFDKELSPSQQRNLENALGVPIMDKTYLILQIFEKRARTKEARLQVEVAMLKYVLPRLAGSYSYMDRQKGGSRNKGTGEKKIELDTRNISRQIQQAQKELKKIEGQRSIQRSKRNRSAIKTVALVGYTNAGKSSIMNGILKKEDKKVFEENMLFATLTTSSRNITLPNNHSFVLSDTVGFVQDLPHSLVEAFHSTLEEVLEADLLLHVIDANNPEYTKHIQVTEETLEEIGASSIPQIRVFNKCDLTEIEYPVKKEDCVYISAKDEESLKTLFECVDQKLFSTKKMQVLIPYSQGKLVDLLYSNAQVFQQENREDGMYFEIELETSLTRFFEPYEKKESE